MCCELPEARVTAKPLTRPFQCVVQPWDAKGIRTTLRHSANKKLLKIGMQNAQDGSIEL